MFAYERLDGLDRERILSAIAPILHAHQLQGVELIWKTDGRGRVLSLTVEPAPIEGQLELGSVSIELCAELSRDISAALDVADCIAANYSLEVGTPGLERALYRLADYERFTGHLVKLKFHEKVADQFAVSGRLLGVEGAILSVESDGAPLAITFDNVKQGRLVYEFGRASPLKPARPGKPGRSPAKGLARPKRRFEQVERTPKKEAR